MKVRGSEMNEKLKEIFQKSKENSWSAEQMEEALKEAGVKEDEFPAPEELDLEEMASVAGGGRGDYPGDPATCTHPFIHRWHKLISSPNPNGGWHVHLSPNWTFGCRNCGQKWEGGTDSRFTFVEGWQGRYS